MSKRYHINPVTGRPNICRAVHACPLGGEHFDSQAEARAAYENSNTVDAYLTGISGKEFESKEEAKKHRKDMESVNSYIKGSTLDYVKAGAGIRPAAHPAAFSEIVKDLTDDEKKELVRKLKHGDIKKLHTAGLDERNKLNNTRQLLNERKHNRNFEDTSFMESARENFKNPDNDFETNAIYKSVVYGEKTLMASSPVLAVWATTAAANGNPTQFGVAAALTAVASAPQWAPNLYNRLSPSKRRKTERDLASKEEILKAHKDYQKTRTENTRLVEEILTSRGINPNKLIKSI